jgi:hypothetical protein
VESAIRIRFVRRLFRIRINFGFAGFFLIFQLFESKRKIRPGKHLLPLCGQGLLPLSAGIAMCVVRAAGISDGGRHGKQMKSIHG